MGKNSVELLLNNFYQNIKKTGPATFGIKYSLINRKLAILTNHSKWEIDKRSKNLIIFILFIMFVPFTNLCISIWNIIVEAIVAFSTPSFSLWRSPMLKDGTVDFFLSSPEVEEGGGREERKKFSQLHT